jgi:hypothetical protein
MKRQYPLWRVVTALILAALFFAAVSGCVRINGASQTLDSPIVGKYRLIGEREVVSEIELNADGRFLYVMSYGAHDEGAVGTWRSTDKQVVLEVDKSMQGQTLPPLTNTIELQLEGKTLVLTRQSNELVYLKDPERKAPDAKGKPLRSKTIELDIHGYNYTDKYIQSFNVNGHGGGNIFMSTPTSGGGSPYCCFYYVVGIGFPYEVEVAWANDAADGPWKKTKVLIPHPKGDVPRYLEVHFYPDGHVEAEMTVSYSEPRLKLTKKNENER